MQELLHYLNSLPLPERDAFAQRVGTTVGYLRKAASSRQKLGETLCVRIANESGGAVSCEHLRPDVDWSVYRRWAADQQPAGQGV